MGFQYDAVAWPQGARDPQPELRRELEDLGFRLLGGCALADRNAAELGRMARSYGDRGADFATWVVEPGQVFASADATAFAQLAWLWDCRYACFSTVLDDGTIVQTMTEWGIDPEWPGLLARFQGLTDRHTEQLALATDRDAQVVDGIPDAWATHQRRVVAAGAPVPRHDELADFVRLWSAESRVRSRWARRMDVVAGILAFLVAVLVLTVLLRALGVQPWWVQAAANLAAMVLCVALYLCLKVLVRGWRWLRPGFRAPVPGTGP